MTEVLEGVAEPISLRQWLIDHANDYDDKLSDEYAQQAVEAGWLFDTTAQRFTDKGFDALEEWGVPLKLLRVVTLGTPVSAFTTKGEKHTLAPGSQLISLKEGKMGKFRNPLDECFIGDDFPVLIIFQNSHHNYAQHRWPVAWGLQFIKN